MTSRDFCYWLQGFFEISGYAALSNEQAVVVRKHLDLVFKHEIDPSHGPDYKKLLADVGHVGLPDAPVIIGC